MVTIAVPGCEFGDTGVKGKTCILDGSQISPDGAGVAALLCGKFSHSGAVFSGLYVPQDPPLPG